jgi:MFS family permease
MVFAVAVALGTVNSVDQPTRQTFIPEMVGRDHLQNAVSLNSVLTNASRAIGPAIAGILIAATGVGVCFLANAASFAAVLVALARIRPRDLHPAPPAGRGTGQLRQGLRYVRGAPGLLVPLLMMALVGTLAYEFPVSLPLVARVTPARRRHHLRIPHRRHGRRRGGRRPGHRGPGPSRPAAVHPGRSRFRRGDDRRRAGSLAARRTDRPGRDRFLQHRIHGHRQHTLQLTADPPFRGRVMALWSVTFTGSTPIGGPIVGVTADSLGPRYGLGLGALACLAATVIGSLTLRRMPPERLGERSADHDAWARSPLAVAHLWLSRARVHIDVPSRTVTIERSGRS